jgi:hypothetical protein
MNFTFHYNDLDETSVKNKSVGFLELFLNYHLCVEFHGWTYDAIIVHFLNNPPPHQKYKIKKTMEYYASVELASNFHDNHSLNLRDFLQGFALVEKIVSMVDGILIEERKDYRVDKLLGDLQSLRKLIPSTDEELVALAKNRTAMEYELPIRRADGHFAACKANPQPKTKKITHTRIFDPFERTLMPYSYMYAEIFGTLLRNEEIETPGYREIYFSIGNTIADAKRSPPLDTRTWSKYTYSSIEVTKFKSASDDEKNAMVVESIAAGLRLIADADHLDKEKIERVIHRVEQEGVAIELSYLVKENKTYRAEVIYQMLPNPKDTIPYYLRLTRKGDGSIGKVLIDRLDTWNAPYSISKISITKDQVTIKGRGGERGEVSRTVDKLPDQYVFAISEIFK